MIIREYKSEDREAVEKCILQLNQEEYNRRPEYWADPETSIGAYVGYLLEDAEKNQGKIFVSEIEGGIVGVISVVMHVDDSPDTRIKKWAYVTDAVVLEEYRNQGIGEQLFKAAESYARECGIEWISLNVSLGNPKALHFYEKHGFTQRMIKLDKKLNE